MNIAFWGVRGSIPIPHADFLRHGGNTTCLSVSDDAGSGLILDAGSGIRTLGLSLPPRRRWNLLLSHFHWDHLQGLPYFAPLYAAHTEITVYAAVPEQRIREALATQMSPPFFPIALDAVAADVRCIELAHGERVEIDGFEVTPFPLRHPGGSTGYRVEGGTGTMVFATDHECLADPDNPIDRGLRDAAQDASLLVMDGQYTPDELAAKPGWGHSSYVQCARIAAAAAVRRIAITHHDPTHDDAALDRIAHAARELFPAASLAHEGRTVVL